MTVVSLPVRREDAFDDERAVSHELIAELAGRIDGEVRFDRHDRMLYSTDASIYQVEPLGVVIPRSVEDVDRTVRFCSERSMPILPRGAGTSLAGQAVNRAVVIDFSPHLNQVVEIDAVNQRARVQPGVVLDQLNREARAHGLMFGPDVATTTHATLGGMIGNNSAGAHSVLYGRTVEHLEALDVVLADGTRVHLDRGASERDVRVADVTKRIAEIIRPIERSIDERFPKIKRHVDGYNLDIMLDQLHRSTPGSFDAVNLAHLFCGAEGTLGVTVEAVVKLVETPRETGLAIIAFPDVDAAVREVIGILETKPAAVELVDEVIIDLARRNLEFERYVERLPMIDDRTPGAVLYVEYFTDSPDELRDRFESLKKTHGTAVVRTYLDAASMNEAWRLRRAGEPLLHGQPGKRKPVTFIEDTAVAPERLPEFVRRFRSIVDEHGMTASYYAHASVGCLHIRPMVALADAGDQRIMRDIMERVTDLVIEFAGALSGEHGDGRLRSPYLQRYFGDEICAAFHDIKKIFDPRNLMNPGNIVEPADALTNLRVRPHERTLAAPACETYYQYEREHGFGEALHLCNGAGVCRKMEGGTMCPSYRALRDERHATRGRANALRLAMTGQFLTKSSQPALNDPETLETLDLCLSCKACKRECPSNVDVAKLKAEYLAQSFDARGGPPWRDRLLSRVRTLNRLGSRAPGLANWSAKSWLGRLTANRLFGIHPRRSLPPFARSLYSWYRSTGREQRARKASGSLVLLLPDCFTTYNEPHIGRAAVEVVEAFGYVVLLPNLDCCGRPYLSSGMLKEGIDQCSRTAAQLLKIISDRPVVAIVTCEPSCASAITDDWTDMRLHVAPDQITRISNETLLIEDFLESYWDDHPRRPEFTWIERETVLHGHCHQKALWGTRLTEQLLARISNEPVRALDTGCCGMAGAFGFTKNRFELSQRIGELSLLPEIRAHPDAAIIAPGTSCRHQIRDAGLGEALHPIELIAQSIRPGQ